MTKGSTSLRRVLGGCFATSADRKWTRAEGLGVATRRYKPSPAGFSLRFRVRNSMMTSMNAPGIYTITNTVSGRVYVGKSLNVPRRLRNHQKELRAGVHVNTWLQRAWNRYGEEAFVFAVVRDMPRATPEDIAKAEGEVADAYERKYNIMLISAEGQFSPPEVRAKIGVKSRERMNRKENRERHIASLKALWADEEHREMRVAGIKAGWSDPEVKAARLKATQDAQARLMKDPNSKISQRHKKRWAASDARNKAASKTAEQWSDPAMKEKMRAALKAGWAKRRERLSASPA